MTNQYWAHVRDLNVDELGEYGSVDQNSVRVQATQVAFQRLQTKAMQEAAAAQIANAADQKDAAEAMIRAANAAEETAKYTHDTAWWMKWSVVVLAISSTITTIVSLLHHN